MKILYVYLSDSIFTRIFVKSLKKVEKGSSKYYFQKRPTPFFLKLKFATKNG